MVQALACLQPQCLRLNHVYNIMAQTLLCLQLHGSEFTMSTPSWLKLNHVYNLNVSDFTVTLSTTSWFRFYHVYNLMVQTLPCLQPHGSEFTMSTTS